jgi:sec-independent protein translocase protein TatA
MGLDNPLHIAFLLIVLLLVFGAKRLPEVGRSLGTGLRGFRDSLSADAVQQPVSSQSLMPPAPAAEVTQLPAGAPRPEDAAADAPPAQVTALRQASEPVPPAA